MTWFNFLGAIAPFAAVGWSLGTLIGHWEREETRGFTPQEKVWSWFWFHKEGLMWVWFGAIALRVILT